MKYSFYPGCAMDEGAKANLHSIKGVAKALDLELEEIADWNCCGSTVASNLVGDFTQQVLTARNLALAEAKGHDILLACSSCYMNLAVTNKRFKEDEQFRARANEALAAGGLHYNGTLRIRQLIEVVVQDVGFEKVARLVTNPLKGLKVAGYVGCQTVRSIPYDFDDPEQPVLMDRLIEALGATPTDFPMRARCCGGLSNITARDVMLDLTYKVLESAVSGGAQVVITPCPMCQMNLDAFQQLVEAKYKVKFNIPVLFFTQLMAVAFGLPAEAQAFKYNIVSPHATMTQFAG
ncbi:MAG: CoB--CoM heterodisulfide reductase iron-sulfur subunit B family protein [Firmicutes bacterium]|nr:CoB--CoM heterodisulfide reductase iron-sulfur subunit B family protein [Bacillota bacterium]